MSRGRRNMEVRWKRCRWDSVGKELQDRWGSQGWGKGRLWEVRWKISKQQEPEKKKGVIRVWVFGQKSYICIYLQIMCLLFVIIFGLFCLCGSKAESLEKKFYRKKGEEHSKSEVFLRVKHLAPGSFGRIDQNSASFITASLQETRSITSFPSCLTWQNITDALWDQRTRGCGEASWIKNMTWDDQSEVERRPKGSSILYHNGTSKGTSSSLSLSEHFLLCFVFLNWATVKVRIKIKVLHT